MHLRVQNRRTSDLQVGTVKPLFCLQEFNIFKALFTWSSISSNPTVILDASCWHLPQVAERPELICHQNGMKVRPCMYEYRTFHEGPCYSRISNATAFLAKIAPRCTPRKNRLCACGVRPIQPTYTALTNWDSNLISEWGYILNIFIYVISSPIHFG